MCFVFTFCINYMKDGEYNGITHDSVISGISSTWSRNCYHKAAQNAVPPLLHCFLSCTFPPHFLLWKLEMLFLQQVNQGSCKQHTSVFPCMGPSSTVDNVVIPWEKNRQLIKMPFLSCTWSYLTYLHCCLLTCSVLLFIPSFQSLGAPSTSLWYFASALPLWLHLSKLAVDDPGSRIPVTGLFIKLCESQETYLPLGFDWGCCFSLFFPAVGMLVFLMHGLIPVHWHRVQM